MPAPLDKLALMRAEHCTVSFYRYLYDTVGEPWLWFERRLMERRALARTGGAARRSRSSVLYVRGVPAGYLRAGVPRRRAKPSYAISGCVPDFIGRRLGLCLLQAAIDSAWSARPIERLWLHTSTFDHPKALRVYQQAGFVAYARRQVSFEDPRERGILPRTLTHCLLPPLKW